MIEDNSNAKHEQYKVKRPQTSIIMKQFRVAGLRPKTPLEVSQLSRVDCTCCNKTVYTNSLQSFNLNSTKESTRTVYNFIGKKLSTQKENQKWMIRSSNRQQHERDLILLKGKRLDPFEYINQKYSEIIKEQETIQNSQQIDQQQSAITDIDSIRDSLFPTFIPKNVYLKQKNNLQSRPTSNIGSVRPSISQNIQIENRSKRDSSTSMDSSSILITKVIDVKKIEENAYYSPRDKALQEIMSSPRTQQLQTSPIPQEIYKSFAHSYFLMNNKPSQQQEQIQQTDNITRKIISSNKQKRQPLLLEVSSSNLYQNRTLSPPIKDQILQAKVKNQQEQSEHSQNAQYAQNQQSMINQTEQEEIQNELNESILNEHHSINSKNLKTNSKIKNSAFFGRQNVLQQNAKINISTTPIKQVNNYINSNTSQQQLSARIDSGRSIHLQTTNSTIKTVQDQLTPQRSDRTHYYNDYIRSIYQADKIHDQSSILNQFSPSREYNQKRHIMQIIQGNKGEQHSKMTWRIQQSEQQQQENHYFIQQKKLINPQQKKVNVSQLLSVSMLSKITPYQNQINSNQSLTSRQQIHKSYSNISLTSREQKRVSFRETSADKQ